MKLPQRLREAVAEPARQTMGLALMALLLAGIALLIALGARHGG